MKITYIHHSSFLVETEENYFLFDYFEGKLPQLKEDKPCWYLPAPSRGSFSPVIFDLVKHMPAPVLCFPNDIWKRRVPEELMGKTYFIGPEEELDLQAPFTGPSGVKSMVLNPQMKAWHFSLKQRESGSTMQVI